MRAANRIPARAGGGRGRRYRHRAASLNSFAILPFHSLLSKTTMKFHQVLLVAVLFSLLPLPLLAFADYSAIPTIPPGGLNWGMTTPEESPNGVRGCRLIDLEHKMAHLDFPENYDAHPTTPPWPWPFKKDKAHRDRIVPGMPLDVVLYVHYVNINSEEQPTHRFHFIGWTLTYSAEQFYELRYSYDAKITAVAEMYIKRWIVGKEWWIRKDWLAPEDQKYVYEFEKGLSKKLGEWRPENEAFDAKVQEPGFKFPHDGKWMGKWTKEVFDRFEAERKKIMDEQTKEDIKRVEDAGGKFYPQDKYKGH